MEERIVSYLIAAAGILANSSSCNALAAPLTPTAPTICSVREIPCGHVERIAPSLDQPDTGEAQEGAIQTHLASGYLFIVNIVTRGALKGASPRTASAQAQ
jgi:hypothetical protein